MAAAVEYDFSLLSEKLSGLSGALGVSGAHAGDLQTMLRTETGQLAARMGDAVGPATQDKAMKQIDRDLKQYLTVLPQYSNLDDGQQYSSTADFTWLVAGPNSLTGINDEDNQVAAGGAAALEMFRGSQKSGSRGGAYISLGRRGKQKIQRLNRTRISKSSMNVVRLSIRLKTGELRAAFYRVAIKYVPNKRVPAWIRSKLDQVVAKGKSGLAEGNMDTPEAFIEFSVRAPGVTSNARITAKLAGAVRGAGESINAKLKKVLAGYKYDWETGRVFRQRSATDFSEN